MIGYTLVGTNDVERARTFYDAVLEIMGARRMMEMPHMSMWGTSWDQPMFGVTLPYDKQPATVGNGSMPALLQPTRAQVRAIYERAMEMGATDEGGPGVRGEEGEQAFYGAYVRDRDGNKLCFYRVGPAD